MSNLTSSQLDQYTLVKSELNKFILEETGQDALSSIDEIVLSYIIGILKSLGSSSSPDDAYDVNEFAEMMSAYIPAFSNINSSRICEWMMYLARYLKKNSNDSDRSSCALEDVLFRSLEKEVPISEVKSNCDIVPKNYQASHSRRKSYQSSRSCSSQSEDEEKCINVIGCSMTTELETLTEMFPHLHILEAKQFLCMADGDCEKAVQLILQKQESGQQMSESIVTKSIVQHTVFGPKEKVVEDKKLREQILKRYAYIDQDDDIREHKPVAPKTEPKKLIRYRDNKIVSIKGERYTEVKSDDTSDVKEKKCH